jgi:hypothetical protein
LPIVLFVGEADWLIPLLAPMSLLKHHDKTYFLGVYAHVNNTLECKYVYHSTADPCFSWIHT